MKINIVYNTTDSPHGGGNQFLKALKRVFVEAGLYADENSADVYLFNSHQNLERVSRLKDMYSKKTFIHRVDGPMRLYNTMDDVRDHTVYSANQLLADGTIFQSDWSKKSNERMGMSHTDLNTVIHNATDSSIFNEYQVEKGSRKRIIAASFSPNVRKGFNCYQFLDDNLDFEKFEFVFAGNLPLKFKNAQHLGCLTSFELARELNKSHVYLTASENDPCSNSLLEALSCGLPAVALRSGGHEEIIDQAGEFFEDNSSVVEQLEKVCSNLEHYKNSINISTIEEVAKKYLGFLMRVHIERS